MEIAGFNFATGIGKINTGQLQTIILYGALVIIVMIFILKFVTNRRLVKIYEQVHGGYVLRSGRYRLVKDKENKECLGAMFGGNKLPGFVFEYWQKVNGIPFFGINRVISIIKLNDYSYKVILPSSSVVEGFADIQTYNSQSWVFFEQKKEYDKKKARGNIWYWIAIGTPSFVCVMIVVLLIAGLYTDGVVIHQSADTMAQQTAILQKICESKGLCLG